MRRSVALEPLQNSQRGRRSCPSTLVQGYLAHKKVPHLCYSQVFTARRSTSSLSMVSSASKSLNVSLAASVRAPFTPHRSPYILHPTPYTLHPTPYTLHPTSYTPSSFFFIEWGTSLISKRLLLGPYSRTVPRVIGGVAVSYERGSPMLSMASSFFSLLSRSYRGTSLITKGPPPRTHHKALGIVPLWGPRRALFLMSEVPL